MAVIGSKVTFSESEVAVTSLGSMTPKFYSTSFITTNNSDFFNDATAYTDNTTRIVNISDSLSISGRINGSPFKTTVGADSEFRGCGIHLEGLFLNHQMEELHMEFSSLILLTIYCGNLVDILLAISMVLS